MTEEKPVEKPIPIISMPRSDFLGVILLGGLIGLVVWALGMMLHRFVFDVYFCQTEITNQCASAKNYAVVAASLIGAIVALVGLIRLRVYRPLLVLIASALSLWGIVQLSWDMNWYVGTLVVVLLYALAFGLYTWVARICEFWIVLLLMIVLVVAVRLALVA